MEQHAQYAGFWIRLLALIIDSIIMLIVFALPTSFIYGQVYWEGNEMIYGFWDLLLNYILPVVLTIFFWVKYLGTPGKMLLKLRVVDEKTGDKLSVGKAIGRYFAYIPAAIPLFLGFFWIGWAKRKQGWHDLLAGSVVVRSETKGPFKFEDIEQPNDQSS